MSYLIFSSFKSWKREKELLFCSINTSLRTESYVIKVRLENGGIYVGVVTRFNEVWSRGPISYVNTKMLRIYWKIFAKTIYNKANGKYRFHFTVHWSTMSISESYSGCKHSLCNKIRVQRTKAVNDSQHNLETKYWK